jgi:ribonuclease BN (tRNA processing enzyme)
VPEGSRLRCVVVGSGSPRLSLERAGASYLALVEGHGQEQGLLFDCGPGTTLRLVQGGFRSQMVGHLFLTHHHYDHCADLGHFSLTRWDHTADPTPLSVHGPPGTEGLVSALFGPHGVYHQDARIRTEHPMGQSIFASRGGVVPRPKPDVRAHDVLHGLVAEGGQGTRGAWRVLAGPASHAQPIAECYSYRLETAERSIVFSGDTGVCPALVAFATAADTLVHMCCFFDEEIARLGMEASVSGPGLAGEVAAGAGVRKLVLTHPQSEAVDTPAGIERAIGEARRHFGGEIVFAHDLLEI